MRTEADEDIPLLNDVSEQRGTRSDAHGIYGYQAHQKGRKERYLYKLSHLC
jgi:hypothetical protein